MAKRHFRELVSAKWDEQKFLCVGLDTDFNKLPDDLRKLGPREGMLRFNVAILEATRAIAGAYKPNVAFYEAHGEDGWAVLKETCHAIIRSAPDVPIILDAKRGDIGNTNDGYAQAAFDLLHADAITVQPYMGGEALAPFLEREDKGVIVLCRTSNGGSAEFQNLSVENEPLYLHVARHVHEEWNKNGNCGLVAGATYPKELAAIRAVAEDLPILIPGIGAQGGDLEMAVQAGLDKQGRGVWVNASRSILYASGGKDYAESAGAMAQQLHSAIVKAL